ncbi:DUF362 domain-containing protein [Candidatus Cyanaurora vandensis]|uniref:DUF362 domain-containing protein n=1 Tax=Candidatus Cyanaurora vandensis TaxID=2714958 RepID=UPI00257EE611|nr:DUF362 domain-containing protein [Candidatus Cyanaurora vandensis]
MSTVSLMRTPSYDAAVLDEALTGVLAPLGGMGAFVQPGQRVLLKPNLLTGSRPTKECTTRPELIQAVALSVRACGGKPFLGDSPAFGTAQGVARANGLWDLCQEIDLPLVEFHGARYASVGEFAHLRLSKEAMGADVVINLPKVKSHCQLTITLGVKNLFGCVPGKLKAWWHLDSGKDSLRFGTMLVQTAQTIAPQLTIIDGIIGHEGMGPSNGEPRFLGLLGAAADVFALDRVFCAILNVDPATVPTLQAATVLGVGPQHLGEIDLVGATLEEVRLTDWQLPPTMMPLDFGVPRVARSFLRDLLVRWVKEPLSRP